MMTRETLCWSPAVVSPFDEEPEGEPRTADEHGCEDCVENEHRRRET